MYFNTIFNIQSRIKKKYDRNTLSVIQQFLKFANIDKLNGIRISGDVVELQGGRNQLMTELSRQQAAGDRITFDRFPGFQRPCWVI